MGYKVTSLKDIYRNIGEDETKCILKDFECALNKDVEYFIKENCYANINIWLQVLTLCIFIYKIYTKEK